VRNLKKQLEKVYRKVALKLVKSDKLEITTLPAAAQRQEQTDASEASASASRGLEVGASEGTKAEASTANEVSSSVTSEGPVNDEASGGKLSTNGQETGSAGTTKKAEPQQKVRLAM
jgi:Lon-like ATP-dependent protease